MRLETVYQPPFPSYPRQSFPPYFHPPIYDNSCFYIHPSAYKLPDRSSWQSVVPDPFYSTNMAQMNSAELEEFQNLSDRYQAELPGPLIGDKLPMTVLVTEYAQADPAFVVKTTALAQTHSAYRAIKGDGQCGWRGAIFAYFELLLELGDMSLLQQELVRLRSFEETMKMAGIDYDIIIDMFDFTWELLDEIRKAIERQDKSESVVLNFMNDEIKSNSIVYHFKMMTSAYMQVRPDQYEPFLEMSIYEYRVARIDPSNQEIDQIGLQALTDAVISLAGFSLEVLYLDRSAGEEVTAHQFSQVPPDSPSIRLLYRPGHYDIVYRDTVAPVQVYLQTEQMISPEHAAQAQQGHYGIAPGHFFQDTSRAQLNQAFGYPPDHSSHNQYQYYTNFNVPPYFPMQQPIPPPIQIPLPSASQQPSLSPHFSSPRSTNISPSPVSAPSTGPNEPQIRMNENIYKLRRHQSVPLDNAANDQASTFHFRSSNFQPQMWNANEDYTTKP